MRRSWQYTDSASKVYERFFSAQSQLIVSKADIFAAGIADPNLTIWHNKIDVCVFVGVHCHYANMALKIIRGGTDCCTIALCAEAGHEDAVISLRDFALADLHALTAAVNRLKARG
ncbi:carbon monoxide dehydrogenase beta subunit family protein [Halochromatium glycolicum]|uniref:carbon monoxide dehydrogenase beta subunit family protein n=1 Tax=Halochromatium glycolicum TaxID=85075 RepID=UPI001909DBC8|nr:carbon monoxide dehydrogenase beta subunit family protein [Halochromatium glycolicum]